MTANALQRNDSRKGYARPTLEDERATGSARTDDIVPDNGYPPKVMKAFCVMWWLMWLAIFILWAVR